MLRKLIIAAILTGSTFSVSASSTITTLFVNNNNTAGYVVVNYDEVVQGQNTPQSLNVPAGQWIALGVLPFPNPVPQYIITSITYYQSSSPQPITSCPVLNFGTTYAGAIITLGNNLECNAVIQLGGQSTHVQK